MQTRESALRPAYRALRAVSILDNPAPVTRDGARLALLTDSDAAAFLAGQEESI